MTVTMNKEKIMNSDINKSGRLRLLISVVFLIIVDVGIFIALFYTGTDLPFLWMLLQFIAVFVLPMIINVFVVLKEWVKTGEWFYYPPPSNKPEFIKKYLFGDWRK